jgi:hypothetical protein
LTERPSHIRKPDVKSRAGSERSSASAEITGVRRDHRRKLVDQLGGLTGAVGRYRGSRRLAADQPDDCQARHVAAHLDGRRHGRIGDNADPAASNY